MLEDDCLSVMRRVILTFLGEFIYTNCNDRFL
nr:MAG TPA: hypothetical protein [Caudoviricetes sp.]